MEHASLDAQVRNVFSDMDTLLLRSQQLVDIYNTVTPDNWVQERQRFLTGRREQPAFSYTTSRAVIEEAKELREQLHQYKDVFRGTPLPDTYLDRLRDYYLDAIADALHGINIVMNVGNERIVPHASRHIWGTPTRETVAFAQQILDDEAPILHELLDLPAAATPVDQLQTDITALFEWFDLSTWRTTVTEKTTHVNPVKRQVLLRANDQNMLNVRGDRLLLHEFGVHVLRAANGWHQPHTLFVTGLHGYETTEEGITTYLEYVTGHLSKELLRRYALRVIAVQSMMDGNPFTETFSRLTWHTDRETAFYTAMRAHRGGGLVKDHIYLQGFQELRTHLAPQNGLQDLGDLYTGKIPLDALDTVRTLQNAGHLEPPRHELNDFLHLLQHHYMA